MAKKEPQTTPPVRGRTGVWRADLVRLLAAVPASQVDASAAQLGFEAPKKLPRQRRPKSVPVSTPPVEPQGQVEPEQPSVPFFRLEQMTFSDPPGASGPDSESPGLQPADLHNPDYSMFFTPKPEPLSPWSRLWPALRNALQGSAKTRNPDLPKLLRMWSRGEVVHRIPHQSRRVWAERVALWVDRGSRTLPFRSDQNEVYRRLLDCCGYRGVQVRVIDVADQATVTARGLDYAAGVRLNPEQSVLVLGDLAAYGSAAEQAAWLRTGQRLRRAGIPIAALAPVPQQLLPVSLAETWSAVPWERGRAALLSSPEGQEGRQARAERLLRLASPAGFVHLGLLRALRRLLPAGDTDAATEVDVFRHPDVRAADSMGFVLHGGAAAQHRQAFAEQELPQLKAEVSQTIGHWHEHVPRELVHGETLTWLSLIHPEEAPPPGSASEALAFADRLSATLRQGTAPTPIAAAVKRCALAMLESLPECSYDGLPTLQQLRESTFVGTAQPQWWSVRQVGDALVFHASADSAWPSSDRGPGSPVAWLRAAGSHLEAKWERGSSFSLALEDGLRIPLRSQGRLTLRSLRSTVTIAPWQREPWATAAGRDRYGLWADASIEGIAVRFRYIPPGRFLMGSPESEAGRYDQEGPQHEVTWTQGYWLADTPCTQAVWERVMRGNLSAFISADRPAENVSWDDSQEFVKRLNEESPELMARLPSEAEWEHACRGGTQTATWVGDLEILGRCNAPLLDEIAWYGGNSGQDYELEQGVNSTNWPDKQYPHTKAGTHEVRKKQANPHGLHDVLGNVYEWCLDMYGTYEAQAVTNPAPSAMGSLRVLRGGSWRDSARLVRAADRNWFSHDFRGYELGFRLARGQGGWEAGTRSGPVGRGEGRAPAASALREAGTTPARSADQKWVGIKNPR